MLQLRVYVRPTTVAAVVEGLDSLAGVRHLSVVETDRDGTRSVTADLDADVADTVLELLERLDVPADDIVLLRLDRIGPVSQQSEPSALVWADLVGQARIQARAPARYFVFMATAGVIAAFGVINLSPDKESVFREIARVLKPGGRVQIADIVVTTAVPEAAKENIDLWTG